MKSLAKSSRRISGAATKKSADLENATAALARAATKATGSGPLEAGLLRKMDAWWRAANYLSVGQTYLYDNPLLKQSLTKEPIKPRLLGLLRRHAPD
jgi:hypothetical protein